MSERVFWEIVYRALIMVAKAVRARYLTSVPIATDRDLESSKAALQE